MQIEPAEVISIVALLFSSGLWFLLGRLWQKLANHDRILSELQKTLHEHRDFHLNRATKL